MSIRTYVDTMRCSVSALLNSLNQSNTIKGTHTRAAGEGVGVVPGPAATEHRGAGTSVRHTLRL